MLVEQFEIEFSIHGRKLKGSCQRYQVANYPQVRVAVGSNRKYPDIYIFYDMRRGRAGKRFYWYPLPGYKDNFARTIAGALRKKLVGK